MKRGENIQFCGRFFNKRGNIGAIGKKGTNCDPCNYSKFFKNIIHVKKILKQ